MRKAPLYSRSPRPDATSAAVAPPGPAPASPVAAAPQRTAWRTRIATLAAGLALLVLGGIAGQSLVPEAVRLTQKEIDASVRRSLEQQPLPSAYARAFAAIAPSVVLVEGLDPESDLPTPEPEAKKSGAPRKPSPERHSTGTGVVIVDDGTILTNLHVVAGAKRLKVTFADGTEADASIVSVQAENDLAVLRARTVPDDLQAATMRSTADLLPGDEVIAVGFPFGIGPSVSGGVVSGLKREFRSPEGARMLTNLIQFDAAANPGNSGGPLVTMDGSVVGIVTAILNPSEQRTFVGIGFAVPIENAAAAAGMPPF